MTTKIERAWLELNKLPPADQEVAAEAILDYASGNRSVELSDDQIAEIERRLREDKPSVVTISEFRRRLRHLGI